MKKISTTTKIAGVLSLAAGAAAVAAGYYFYGKNGKLHRKQAAVWEEKFKTEVLKKIEQMKQVTEKAYQDVVDEIVEKYQTAKNVDPKELKIFADELKSHWEKISKDASKLITKETAKK